MWRIGNAQLVRVWGDPSLLRPYDFKPFSFVLRFWNGRFLSELIDEQRDCWRENLIKAVFLEHEAEIICAIPLCDCWPDD
mgnify:CR=1 FL=1